MQAPATLRALSADGQLLFITRALRTFAYGITAVTLGVYLPGIGLSVVEVGIVFAAALAGGALMTLVLATIADSVGRRRVLIVGALLMAIAGAVFAATTSMVVLVVAAIFGTISPHAGEVGPFQSVEQAILPETAPPTLRTSVFAWYNLVGSATAALGALSAALPSTVQSLTGWSEVEAARLLLLLYAATALAMVPLFARLSPSVEAPPRTTRRSLIGVHRSRGIVFRLSALFAVDAFAGGLAVQGLIAYWFRLRFDADLASLGGILFAANLASALSLLFAARLSNRFGLVNTMVFSHIPANMFMALMPFMPTAPLAIVVLLARQSLSQMDVPTRQSYMVAVVDPDERSAAAGITSVVRNVASSGGPVLAGQLMTAAWPGLPFVICGVMKIAYDVGLWLSFRELRTPEEQARRAARLGSNS